MLRTNKPIPITLIHPYIYAGLPSIDSPYFIVQVVLDLYGYTLDEVKEKNRKGIRAEARQMAMYFIVRILRIERKRMHKKVTIGLSDIGNMFDRDHASVLYSYNTIENGWRFNAKTKEKYLDLCEKFNLNPNL